LARRLGVVNQRCEPDSKRRLATMEEGEADRITAATRDGRRGGWLKWR